MQLPTPQELADSPAERDRWRRILSQCVPMPIHRAADEFNAGIRDLALVALRAIDILDHLNKEP